MCSAWRIGLLLPCIPDAGTRPLMDASFRELAWGLTGGEALSSAPAKAANTRGWEIAGFLTEFTLSGGPGAHLEGP